MLDKVQIETKKENLNAIDLMKFIMAFFVIAIHTGPMSNSTNSIIRTVYNFFSGSAVPFFFLASGYLLGKKFTHSETDTAMVMQRLKKTVYIYVFWTFVYFPLAVIPWVKYKTPLNLAFFEYVRYFSFVGEHYNSWTLWYLLSTIYALLFVWFLLKHNVGLKVIAALGMVVISLSFFIDSFISYNGVMPEPLGLVRRVLQSTIVSGRVLRGIFYIPMGMLLSQYKIPLWGGVTLLAIGYGVDIVSDGYISAYAHIVLCIGLFSTVACLKLPDARIYRTLRKLSTDMYFLHMWVWTVYYVLVYGEKTFGFDCCIATTIICIMISLSNSWMKRVLGTGGQY